MKLPTLKELESLGFIKDISTPRQVKKGTTVYEDTDPLSPYYKVRLGIYTNKDTGRIYYKDISTLCKLLPDEKPFIYRVINNRLFRVPKCYGGRTDRQYYFCEYPSTTKSVSHIVFFQYKMKQLFFFLLRPTGLLCLNLEQRILP